MEPAERLKLREQMAAAAGKEESVSLSLFHGKCIIWKLRELSTMATLAWADGENGRNEQLKVWRKQILEVQTRRQGERTCRSGHVRDPVTWTSRPHWHTCFFF